MATVKRGFEAVQHCEYRPQLQELQLIDSEHIWRPAVPSGALPTGLGESYVSTSFVNTISARSGRTPKIEHLAIGFGYHSDLMDIVTEVARHGLRGITTSEGAGRGRKKNMAWSHGPLQASRGSGGVAIFTLIRRLTSVSFTATWI